MNDTSEIETVARLSTEVATTEPFLGIRLLPGENPTDKEQLRPDLVAELAPKTTYQKRLVDQLVDYEWEIDRHRRLRDQCILAQYQARARTLLERGRAVEPFKGTSLKPDDELLARDLVEPDRRGATRSGSGISSTAPTGTPNTFLPWRLETAPPPTPTRTESAISSGRVQPASQGIRRHEVCPPRYRVIEDAEIIEDRE
jgi:hypothetical protein